MIGKIKRRLSGQGHPYDLRLRLLRHFCVLASDCQAASELDSEASGALFSRYILYAHVKSQKRYKEAQ